MNKHTRTRRTHSSWNAATNRYRTRRRAATLSVLVAASGLFVACGGTDTPEADGYCASVADAEADFAVLQAGDVAQFDDAFRALHELAKESPEAIDRDWKVLDGAIGDLESALSAAGLTVTDLDAVGAGNLPEDLDPRDLDALLTDLEALASDDVAAAADAIERHAFEECDVELAAAG